MSKWAIVVKKDNKFHFASKKNPCDYTEKIDDAMLYDSRNEARTDIFKSPFGREQVMKITLKLETTTR